jgi:single-strand DNA-binding protein
MYETHATVIGTVINDPRQRRTMEGLKVVNFRLAANERKFDRETGEWKDGERLIVSVTCWRKLANGVGASLTKGDPVMATGRLYTRTFEVDGQQRWSLDMDATAVGPDLARCSAEVQRNRRDGLSEAAGEQLVGSGARDAAPREVEVVEREVVAV